VIEAGGGEDGNADRMEVEFEILGGERIRVVVEVRLVIVRLVMVRLATVMLISASVGELQDVVIDPRGSIRGSKL
jgi:hypothetical protein